MFADRGGQLGERLFIVRQARLCRVGEDAVNRDLADLGMGRPRLDERDDTRGKVDGRRFIEEAMDVFGEGRPLATQVRSPRVPGRGTREQLRNSMRTPSL